MDRILLQAIRKTLCILVSVGFLSEGKLQAQQFKAFHGAMIETAADSGLIRRGTILVRGGKIEAVSQDVELPLSATEIDLRGKWVMPGIVDPYFVVSLGSSSKPSEEREIVVGGRIIRIPASSGSTISTDFRRMLDSFDPRTQDWQTAVRNGITSAHVVSNGFGQSALIRMNPGQSATFLDTAPSHLYIALTNQSAILDVLRRGLAKKSRPGNAENTNSGNLDSRSQSDRGRESVPGMPLAEQDSSNSQNKPAPSSQDQPPQQTLWMNIRNGKQPLFANVNNAATILYLANEAKKTENAKISLVATGENLFQTMHVLDSKQIVIIMPPRIDLIPNSRDRVNVARVLNENKYTITFSLSLNQNEFRLSQENPLFAVAMLVRSGLDRQTAIQALTKTPATLLGIANSVGSIEKGKSGDFIVFDQDPLSGTASIEQVFVEGNLVYER